MDIDLVFKIAAVGIIVSILAETPVGSTIVAADTAAFLICHIISKARGMQA